MIFRQKDTAWYVWMDTYLGRRRACIKAEQLSKRDGIKTWVVPVPGKMLTGYRHAFWIVTCASKAKEPGPGWRRVSHNPLPWYVRWQNMPCLSIVRKTARKEGAS